MSRNRDLRGEYHDRGGNMKLRGRDLRAERQHLGVTQAELAKAAKLARVLLSGIEIERYTAVSPSVEDLMAVLRAMGDNKATQGKEKKDA